MRPLVVLLTLLALALVACQAPGPSSALEVQPAVGAGARVFAGPQDGVGAAARVDLGKYGFRTGKAAEAAGAGLNVEGPKDTTPWGLLSWAISTGLLVVLNEKRKREAKAVLDAAKQESADVVARQDDAPFVGSGGKLEPEHRLADAPSRLDAVELALAAAGVLKRP